MTESTRTGIGDLWVVLRRRKVVQWTLAYVAVAWALLQGLGFLADAFHWPDAAKQAAAVVLLAGIPLVLVLAWYHGDRGHQGIARTEIAILAVVVALGGGLLWRVLETPNDSAPPAAAGSARTAAPPASGPAKSLKVGEKSIAVLPFVPLSQGAEDAYFADGLTEEILNALAQLPELQVTARTSAFHFKGTSTPIPEVARQLGVANVLEGSVRRSGSRTRVTAQLIRARDGFHLWSADYDREATDTIAIQDDIAERVAAAMNVLLDDSRRAAMHRALSSDVEAFVDFQKGLDLYEKAHANRQSANFLPTLRQSKAAFDAALAREPNLFPARLLGIDVYTHELLDPLVWGSPAPLPPAQAAEAQAAIHERLELALDRARNEEERNSATVTRIYLSNDWHGFAGASARQFAGTNCVMTEFNDAPIALGYAARAKEFYRLAIACDPLLPDYYWNLARATLWMGDAKQALAVIEESRRRGAYDARDAWIAVISLAALERYEEADALAASGEGTTLITRAHNEVLIAAAGGRADVARTKWNALPATAHSPRNDLLLLAWLGDRSGANAIASEIDRLPFGNVALAELTLHCYCGAPFDIEQTPNFKARIAESGLAWPPKKPVPVPLKDW